MSIAADSFLNKNLSDVKSNSTLDIILADNLNNESSVIFSKDSLNIISDFGAINNSNTNSQRSLIQSDNNIILTTNNYNNINNLINNNNSDVIALDLLQINVGNSDVNNFNDASFYSEQEIIINSVNSINNHGSITSEGDIDIYNFTLDNQKQNIAKLVNEGLIFAIGDLDIKSEIIENKSINSIGDNIAKIVSNANINILSSNIINEGRISASGFFDIDTNYLHNSGTIESKISSPIITQQNCSHLSSSCNIISIKSSDYQLQDNLISSFSNENGIIISNYDLKIINNLGTVENSGTIKSSNNLTITANEIANVATKDKTLTHITDELEDGQLVSNELILNEGIISSNNLILTANLLSNDDGYLKSENEAIITIENNNNLDIKGLIDANNNLTINANDIVNYSKIGKNTQNIILNASGNLNNSLDSEITAQNNLTIFSNDLNNYSVLSAKNLLTITSQGNINNGNETTQTDSIIPKITGGSNLTKITSENGYIKNYGKISGAGDLEIIANKVRTNNINLVYDSTNYGINNYAQIASGDDLTISSKTFILNEGSDRLIFALNNMNLLSDDYLKNNFAKIWAGKNIQMQNSTADIYNLNYDFESLSNTQQNSELAIINNAKNNNIINKAGTIESYEGDINIFTKDLKNEKGNENVIIFDREVIEFVHKDTSDNSANIKYIHGDRHGNKLMSYDGPKRTSHTSGGSYFQHLGYHSRLNLDKNRLNDGYKVEIGGLTWWDYRAGIDRKSRIFKENPNLTKALIKSKNNLNIFANTMTNDASEINSGSNMLLKGNSLSNKSYNINSNFSYRCHHSSEWCRVTHKRVNGVIVGHRVGLSKDNFNFAFSKKTGEVNSKIIAGAKLKGDFKNKIDNNSISEDNGDNKVGDESIDTQFYNSTAADYAFYDNGSSGQDFSYESDDNSLKNKIVDIDDKSSSIEYSSGTPKIYLPNGNFGLFKINNLNTRYLIETNVDFIDVNKFVGSDYLFSRLGINPNNVIFRRLGDAFYEQREVMKKINNINNHSYLEEQILDDNQQMKTLFDNAVELSLSDSSLEIGKELSDQQIANLKQDILWLVEEEVNGETLLVNKLYLSKSTKEKIEENEKKQIGSIIEGSEVEFTTNYINSNFGTIKSLQGDLEIKSDNIELRNTLLDSAKAIELMATNDITLANKDSFGDAISGKYQDDSISQFSAVVQANDDSIIASNSLTSTNIKDEAQNIRDSIIYNSADDIKISGKNVTIANNQINSGGNIFVDATNDINNSNYIVEASDNVVMNAGNDINNIHTTINNNETRIEAGKMVSLDAGNDINNIGAEIKGGEYVYATAGNDINNKALIDYKINEKNVTKEEAMSSNADNISSTLVAQGNITSDGNVVLVANNDINNIASNIATTGLNSDLEGSAHIEATQGDVNIETDTLRTRNVRRWHSKKNRGISIKDNINNIQSNINIANNLSVISGNDTNIKGSNVNVGGDLTTDSTGNLNIESVQDESYSFYANYKRGSFGRRSSSTSTTNKTTNVKSNINVAGDITSDSQKNITILASNVTSESGDIELKAKENVNILSGQDFSETIVTSKKRGLSTKSNSKELNQNTTQVSSDINSNNGNISIASGGDTNIIASNIIGSGDGNITVGTYVDNDVNSETYGQIITNDAANLNILNAIDTQRFYSELTKTKTGFSLENALMTAAMVAAVAFTGGAATAVVAAGAAGGGAIGSINQQKTTKITSKYDETVVSSNLNFGNNLTLSSLNDVTLQASKIEAGGDITINAANNLAIATATETHQTSHELKDKGNYFFKNGQSGNYNKKIINTEISSNGGTNSGLIFNVGNATVAQYNKASGDNSTTIAKTGLDGTILYGDFSQNSKLSYLDKLDSSNTLYEGVEEVSKSWDQTSRGLTSAGQAVVAITATALTMGAMDPVSGSWTQGALVAGSSAASSTAAISATNSAVNANGDLFKQLKTISKDSWDNTTSKESVRNIIIAASAAGLATGLTNIAGGGTFTTPAKSTTAVSGNASAFERVATNFKTSFTDVAINTVSSSAAQSAVNGDSFTDSLKNQGKNILIYTAAKVGANEIGRAYHGTVDQYGNVVEKGIISKPTQLALHAGLGCTVGAAGGGDCASGAVSGVVGEAIGTSLKSQVDNGAIKKETAIQLAGLGGGLSAIFTGNAVGLSDSKVADNIFSGQRIASNAAENNALTALEYMDEEIDNMWLNDDVSDEQRQEYKQARLANDKMSGEILLTAGTLGGASLLFQGGKAVGKNILTAKLASANVNGISGASGGAWGAYVSGGDKNQILKSAGASGLLGFTTGFMLNTSGGVIPGFISSTSMGMVTGGSSAYYYTDLINPDASDIAVLNNVAEGVIGGGLVGLTSAAFTPVNSGIAGRIIGAQTALPVDMFIGVIGKRYNIINIPQSNKNY